MTMFAAPSSKYCQQKLADARLKVESILKAEGENVTLKNFKRILSFFLNKGPMVIKLPDNLSEAITEVSELL